MTMTSQKKPKYPDYSETTFASILTRRICEALEANGFRQCYPESPNTKEEGGKGRASAKNDLQGVDVRIEGAGTPLFLQFKRSFKFSIHSCRDGELKSRLEELGVRSLEFQFDLRESQHKALVSRLKSEPHVYYAAPLFLKASQLKTKFLEGGDELIKSTAFIRPQQSGVDHSSSPVIKNPQLANQIGEGSHRMLFNDHQAFICSEPIAIKQFLTGSQLLDALVKNLNIGDLKQYLDDLFERMKMIDGEVFQEFGQRVSNNDTYPPDLQKYLQLKDYFKAKYELEFFLFVEDAKQHKRKLLQATQKNMLELPDLLN